MLSAGQRAAVASTTAAADVTGEACTGRKPGMPAANSVNAEVGVAAAAEPVAMVPAAAAPALAAPDASS